MQFGIRKLLFLAAAVAVVCALYVSARNYYYAERRHAELVLAEVSGISNVKLHSYVDVVEEVASTSFSVDGQADSVVAVAGLGNYKNDRSISVSSLGKWRFRVFGQRHVGAYSVDTGKPVVSQYLGCHIQLGPASPYKDLLPFEVSKLQDVVDHYAELEELFEHWPRAAKPGSVILEDGTTQFFYVVEEGQ